MGGMNETCRAEVLESATLQLGGRPRGLAWRWGPPAAAHNALASSFSSSSSSLALPLSLCQGRAEGSGLASSPRPGVSAKCHRAPGGFTAAVRGWDWESGGGHVLRLNGFIQWPFLSQLAQSPSAPLYACRGQWHKWLFPSHGQTSPLQPCRK